MEMFIRATLALIVFGVGRIVCSSRGHKWSKVIAWKNQRERFCPRCSAVEHWTE